MLLKFKPVNLDVLPLYIVLMGFFPPVLWIMLRRPNLTMLASLVRDAAGEANARAALDDQLARLRRPAGPRRVGHPVRAQVGDALAHGAREGDGFLDAN